MCRVSASLVLWRSSPEMVATLCRSLAASRLQLAEVWIHANDDPDEQIASTISTLIEGTVPARVSSSIENLGYAAAHNRLIDRAFASTPVDFVLVVNPDIRVAPDAIGQMVEFYHARPKPSLVGPVLESAEGPEVEPSGLLDSAGIRWSRSGRHFDSLQGQPCDKAPRRPVRVSGISGACLLVSREVFASIVATTGEFFDEDFFAYREDAELGFRASLLGIESWVLPAARVWHVRRLRGQQRRLDVDIDRLGVRNRFLFAFKYGVDRPGGWFGAPLRDFVVLVGVIVRERTSWSGVIEAWRLRRRMRRKRASIRQAKAVP